MCLKISGVCTYSIAARYHVGGTPPIEIFVMERVLWVLRLQVDGSRSGGEMAGFRHDGLTAQGTFLERE